jgi:hypothetical protein
VKKKLVKLNCHICKFDRWYSEKTARYVTRLPYPFLCEKCLAAMKENIKKLLEDGPKWEGITVDCDMNLAKHLEKTKKAIGVE